MELSEEMKEVLRILREDGQIASYRQMTQSHKELVERLDHIENKGAERDAKWEEKFGTLPTEPKEPENTPGPENTPTPPPPVETPKEPAPKEGRKAWWERDTYAG